MSGLGLSSQTQEPANAPLLELVDTYSQCLNLSQDFASATLPHKGRLEAKTVENQERQTEENEVNISSLEAFLAIRADLFSLAESSLERLQSQPRPTEDDSVRRELTSQALHILKEMADIEGHMTTYLKEQLSKIRKTLLQIKKTQPVFKRYANLRTHTQPVRLSHHE